MSRSVHTITIPSSTRYLEDVRRFVRKHATMASFSPETVNALQLAVDEACANVIEHAYRGDESNTIEVDIVLKSDRVTVRIRDKGEPFGQTEYRPPDIFEYAAMKRSGGFGVHLIRTLADSVEYTTRGASNVCSLTMYRPAEESKHPPAANNRHADGQVMPGKSGRRSASVAGSKVPGKPAPGSKQKSVRRKRG